MVCIPLTPRHHAARRRWTAEHRDWEQHDWSQVLFTDESRFSLECDTRRVLVWRDRDTRNNPAFVRERSQYRRAGWMVWDGNKQHRRTYGPAYHSKWYFDGPKVCRRDTSTSCHPLRWSHWRFLCFPG
ncbi:HTH_Tnp_Tc3_2 domain-containing protein [Trichonephila clavipes]|nr:HTH_Tnp_Tc3_2 domain-containing protein [Trichonephila clavipes]